VGFEPATHSVELRQEEQALVERMLVVIHVREQHQHPHPPALRNALELRRVAASVLSRTPPMMHVLTNPNRDP
jgi:hypothetical protein